MGSWVVCKKIWKKKKEGRKKRKRKENVSVVFCFPCLLLFSKTLVKHSLLDSEVSGRCFRFRETRLGLSLIAVHEIRQHPAFAFFPWSALLSSLSYILLAWVTQASVFQGWELSPVWEGWFWTSWSCRQLALWQPHKSSCSVWSTWPPACT